MQTADRSRSMTEGTIWKKLAFFAIPVLFGSVFQYLYSTVDALVVGRFIGKEALAAIDATASFVRIFINLFVGISSGAGILISQQYGARQEEALSETLHTSIAFSLAGGLLLALLGQAIAAPGQRLLGVPQELLRLSDPYLRISFAGLFPSMAYNMAAGALRATGDSRRPLYILIASTLSNIVLDLLFVVVFHWGVAGAAWATFISQVLSAVLGLWMLARSRGALRLRLSRLRLPPRVVGRILRVGVPVGVQSAMYPISNTLIMSRINRLGTDIIAAWAVCGRLDFPIWLMIDALSISISTFSAQNYGAGQLPRLRHGVRVAIGMGFAMILPMSAILIFASEPLSRLFVGDAEVVRITTQLMRFYAPFFVTYVAGDLLAGAIRGSGETFRPMLLTLTCTCLLRVLWVVLLPASATAMHIILVYPATWILTTAAFVLYYRRYARAYFGGDAAPLPGRESSPR